MPTFLNSEADNFSPLPNNSQSMTTQLTIGAFLFDGFEALDLSGPYSLLQKASAHAKASTKFVTVGDTKSRPLESTQMFSLWADHDFASCPKLDLLLVPGGIGTLKQIYDQKHIDFMKKCEKEKTRFASVCSGSIFLAAAGLLDSKRATTNKMTWDLLTSLPSSSKTTWVKEARYVEAENVSTSSGVSAGVDLGYKLASDLFREDAAKAAVKDLQHAPNGPHDDPFCKIDYSMGGVKVWGMTTAMPFAASYVVSDALANHKKTSTGFLFSKPKPLVVVVIPDDGFEFLDVGNAAEVFGAEVAAMKLVFVAVSSKTRSEKKVEGANGTIFLEPHTTVSSADELFKLYPKPTCVVLAGSEKGAGSSCLKILEEVIKKAVAEQVPHVVAAGASGKKAAEGTNVQVVGSGMPVASGCLKVMEAVKGPAIAKKCAEAAELSSDYLSFV
ncbi:hypothetical protein HDU97_006085 [Phlyctochytrium planicorne]|nr:hypothetical protein HDU97_006085 [Phlyctochytrium planicorne]